MKFPWLALGIAAVVVAVLIATSPSNETAVAVVVTLVVGWILGFATGSQMTYSLFQKEKVRNQVLRAQAPGSDPKDPFRPRKAAEPGQPRQEL
jgi:hypothetical protein